MGQQISQPSRSLPVLLWAMLFVLCASCADAQITATAAPLILPSAIAYDVAGNLYIAEAGNHVIRKVDTAGKITTIAGTGTQGFSGDNGAATAALLDSPQGLALGGGNLYIADTHNHRIRKLNLTTGDISTIAGSSAGFSGDNGPATAAQLNLPTALALDGSDDLYVADTQNHRIREVNLGSGIITTVAGNGTQDFSGDGGPATAAAIDSPSGLVVDADQNLYLADTHNHRVRKITAATGTITTVAGATAGFSGDNGAASAARLALPHGLSIDGAGDLYIADTANHRIRRIDAVTGKITTVAGDGTQNFSGDGNTATAASLDSPRATTITAAGLVTLADTANQRVRQLDTQATPDIHTVAGLSSIPSTNLSLTAPSTMLYGTGELTATLASGNASGTITFTLLDPTTATGTTLETAPLMASAANFDTSALSVGTYSVLASYSGDQTSSQSQPISFSITPRPLTATPDPITLLYGQPIPTLTGTLNGDLPQDDANLTATFAAPIAAFAPAAVYPITAALSGAAAKNYSFTAAPASVTIAPAPTVATLTPSATSIGAGAPLTLTATATPTTAGTPTGTLTVKDGADTLFSAANPATFTTSSLAPGVHTLSMQYAGDRNFIASVSNSLLITVIAAPPNAPDFTFTPAGATSQTIPSGGTANFNFTMQIQGAALSSPITLAATGLPPLATASFNPAYLPPGTTPDSFTLTINMPQTTALGRSLETPLFGLLLFPVVGIALRKRIRGSFVSIIACVVVIGSLAFCCGCGSRVNSGGSSANPPSTYSITVTGTATTPTGGTLQRSTKVSLLVESTG
ncbi:MAG TPA: Ig-like domain repeat protein [Edaphobacter sp.]|uniref:Ig-like domain repeat protein n=1 Tax=Edaphobacter sp. TaxID=1934404 RepID=UPI002BC44419|nr:Ig-like domain repeat protein [Edaphobacter sp.]HUZ97611.1 Ig-like domain repeat protein [Edaphobacter sp.]